MASALTEMERRRHLLRIYGEKKKGTNKRHRVVDAFCKGMDLTDNARERCVHRIVEVYLVRCASSCRKRRPRKARKGLLCNQGALPLPARGVASESSPK